MKDEDIKKRGRKIRELGFKSTTLTPWFCFISKTLPPCFFSLSLLTACTERSLDLEKVLSAKLERFKISNEPSMDLNELLGKNWKKVCVQWPYALKADFNKQAGEHISLLDISENEMVFWVFYQNGSARAAIINRNIMDFILPRNVSTSTFCTSVQNPHLYAYEYNGIRGYFYFRNQ